MICHFWLEEVREAKGLAKTPKPLEQGICAALLDEWIAQHWVLIETDDKEDSNADDDHNKMHKNAPVASILALQEWSDWNAGHHWWIQSMFILALCRGFGCMDLPLGAVKAARQEQGGLELCLCTGLG